MSLPDYVNLVRSRMSGVSKDQNVFIQTLLISVAHHVMPLVDFSAAIPVSKACITKPQPQTPKSFACTTEPLATTHR